VISRAKYFPWERDVLLSPSNRGSDLAPKIPLLEQMRRNPRGDWTIDDVAKLCAEHHIELEAPSGGSHYKAISPFLPGHLTIQERHRRIKPPYIRSLVAMVDVHIETMKQGKLGE
jgi:hypothetical protein